MFDKILIANRGEIACRIISTAQKMGVKTVAVYSEADRQAKHVAMADEAWFIGGSPATESYLVAQKIIDVALKSKAKAIHPGYGFLSENASFAELCTENDIVFIGPGVEAIKAMGSKSAAKEIMQKAGIPLVPGYHGSDQSKQHLLKEALKIGFPILLKATAGGGGKGMRIVLNEQDFAEALSSCKRESKASFADDEILLEKYLTQPRHVEIQVFADNFGNAVHLYERDCSVQRRHQKVIEEAPAPNIDSKIKAEMASVAIKAAQAINYSGAGTIEFLYDQDGSYYFMEMNTRLQVEHPVTEMITGLDLVEWQLLVAANNPLPLQQAEIPCIGHSFEVRIYAEDPNQDFLPSTGTINYLRTPSASENVRIDSGIVEGDEVSIYYDPMIAKLIVWDKDRASALYKLRLALEQYKVIGLKTNLGFLSALAANKAFNALELDTSLIEKQSDVLFTEDPVADDQSLIIAALFLINKQSMTTLDTALKTNESNSPWHQVNGWRIGEPQTKTFEFTDSENLNRLVQLSFDESSFKININGHHYYASSGLDGSTLSVTIDGHNFIAEIVEGGSKLTIITEGKIVGLSQVDHLESIDDSQQTGNLTAPMPGTVIEVKVSVGDVVTTGQTLMVLEAMKMEHTISAPQGGTIEELFYNVGDLVADGAELIMINEAEE